MNHFVIREESRFQVILSKRTNAKHLQTNKHVHTRTNAQISHQEMDRLLLNENCPLITKTNHNQKIMLCITKHELQAYLEFIENRRERHYLWNKTVPIVHQK
jgi:hypothetical protein